MSGGWKFPRKQINGHDRLGGNQKCGEKIGWETSGGTEDASCPPDFQAQAELSTVFRGKESPQWSHAPGQGAPMGGLRAGSCHLEAQLQGREETIL